MGTGGGGVGGGEYAGPSPVLSLRYRFPNVPLYERSVVWTLLLVEIRECRGARTKREVDGGAQVLEQHDGAGMGRAMRRRCTSCMSGALAEWRTEMNESVSARRRQLSSEGMLPPKVATLPKIATNSRTLIGSSVGPERSRGMRGRYQACPCM